MGWGETRVKETKREGEGKKEMVAGKQREEKKGKEKPSQDRYLKG